MNKRMTAYIIGVLLLAEAGLMLLPACVALYYGEWPCVSAYVFTAGMLATVSYFLIRLRVSTRTIYSREGLVAVALGWVVLSLGGSLPVVFSGEIPSYIDAFFESVSGFTTTGASILEDVEIMSRGLLFWRSFTHWIGGMGVIVLMMALLPSDGKSGRAMHIMRAEMPGPVVGKLVPRVRETAKILYLIYIVMTVLNLIFLLCGFSIFGSSFFTALNNGLVSASISFLRTLVCQVVAVLVLPIFFGLDGIWWSVVVSEVASVLLTAFCIIKFRKRYHYG